MEGSSNGDQNQNSPENMAEKTAEIVSNMALAHELVMNDSFEFKDFPDNSIEKHVKDIVHKAFWDKLREDLESEPPVYTHTLNLLVELKGNLLDLLLPQHNSLKTLINEFLDVDLIKQKIDHGAFDLQQYAKAVVDILSKLCAPVRDDQVKALLDVTGIVDTFREIFKVIDLMKMDMANYHLQALKPRLLQQSIEYERTKFKQYLETNPEGLKSTKVWLSKGKEVVLSTESSSSNNPPNYLDILAHAYLGIIFGEANWPYPETLIMDELRLAEMRTSIHRTMLSGCIIFVTMQTVARQLQGDTEFLQDLKQALVVLLDGSQETDITSTLTSIYEQVKQETNKYLEKRGFSRITDDQETVINGQIIALGDQNQNIRKLLTKRTYEFMLNIFKSFANQGSGTKTNDHPVPPGMQSVGTELSELAVRFGRLVCHNLMTYKPFYNDILLDINSQSTKD